jgi:hypothetical protein
MDDEETFAVELDRERASDGAALDAAVSAGVNYGLRTVLSLIRSEFGRMGLREFDVDAMEDCLHDVAMTSAEHLRGYYINKAFTRANEASANVFRAVMAGIGIGEKR